MAAPGGANQIARRVIDDLIEFSGETSLLNDLRVRTCGISRWKVDNKTHKVYENIPAKIQHAWRTIDEKFPKITEDLRNLQLGISVDGVDVNTGNRHHTIPVQWIKGSVVCGKQKKHLMDKRISPLYSNTREQIYNDTSILKISGKGKRINNMASENQEDMKVKVQIQKKKRNTTEEEGSSSQVNRQNGAYWKKFNIWYRKLRYWRHNSVPHCIDFMHVEKNVAKSLVGTFLHVSGKTKDGVNARLDLAELGGQTRVVCYARRRQNNTTSSRLHIDEC
ncbi:hypothetical protein Tco_0674028 [Tanacetum coccineum]